MFWPIRLYGELEAAEYLDCSVEELRYWSRQLGLRRYKTRRFYRGFKKEDLDRIKPYVEDYDKPHHSPFDLTNESEDINNA
jgi:hypothetical protein